MVVRVLIRFERASRFALRDAPPALSFPKTAKGQRKNDSMGKPLVRLLRLEEV